MVGDTHQTDEKAVYSERDRYDRLVKLDQFIVLCKLVGKNSVKMGERGEGDHVHRVEPVVS